MVDHYLPIKVLSVPPGACATLSTNTGVGDLAYLSCCTLEKTKNICTRAVDMIRWSEMGVRHGGVDTVVAADPTLLAHPPLFKSAAAKLMKGQDFGAPTGPRPASPKWKLAAYLQTPGVEQLS